MDLTELRSVYDNAVSQIQVLGKITEKKKLKIKIFF